MYVLFANCVDARQKMKKKFYSFVVLAKLNLSNLVCIVQTQKLPKKNTESLVDKSISKRSSYNVQQIQAGYNLLSFERATFFRC